MSPRNASNTGASTAAIAFLALSSSAQVQVEWQDVHDGPLGLGSLGGRCLVEANGDVVVAGHMNLSSEPLRDFGLVKYSATGATLWSVEQDLGQDELVWDAALAPSGDIYVGGVTYTVSSSDGALAKFTPSGVFVWAATIPDLAIAAVQCDGQGNAILCGGQNNAATSWDAYIASYSPSGSQNWALVLDGGVGGPDYATSMRVLPNGDAIVAGAQRSATGRGDLVVWKVAASGALIWTRAIDGGFHLADAAQCVAVSAAGKVAAAGYRHALVDDDDWMIAQLDLATGAVDWTAFGTAGGTSEFVQAVAIDRGGVVWAFGQSTLPNSTDLTVRRYSPSGASISSTPWAFGPFSVVPSVNAVDLTLGSAGQVWATASGYVHAGAYFERTWIRQFDVSGAIDWERTFSTGTANAVRLAPGDRLVITGSATNPTTQLPMMSTVQLDLRDSPQAYCTAKTTANGCTPTVTFTGMPSASAANGFVVRADTLRNEKYGMLFYGLGGPSSTPFHGGTLCVAAPHARTMVQGSGGNALPVEDCSGVYQLDMNAYAAGALGGSPLPALRVPGTVVCCQFWGRDLGFAPPNNAMLSNALRYVVLP
jgi:hypothetical protein